MKFDKIIEENSKLDALKGLITHDKEFEELLKNIDTLPTLVYNIYKSMKKYRSSLKDYGEQGILARDYDTLSPDQQKEYDRTLSIYTLPDVLEDHAELIRKIIED
jgi:hypothetical protein